MSCLAPCSSLWSQTGLASASPQEQQSPFLLFSCCSTAAEQIAAAAAVDTDTQCCVLLLHRALIYSCLLQLWREGRPQSPRDSQCLPRDFEQLLPLCSSSNSSISRNISSGSFACVSVLGGVFSCCLSFFRSFVWCSI